MKRGDLVIVPSLSEWNRPGILYNVYRDSNLVDVGIPHNGEVTRSPSPARYGRTPIRVFTLPPSEVFPWPRWQLPAKCEGLPR